MEEYPDNTPESFGQHSWIISWYGFDLIHELFTICFNTVGDNVSGGFRGYGEFMSNRGNRSVSSGRTRPKSVWSEDRIIKKRGDVTIYKSDGDVKVGGVIGHSVDDTNRSKVSTRLTPIHRTGSGGLDLHLLRPKLRSRQTDFGQQKGDLASLPFCVSLSFCTLSER